MPIVTVAGQKYPFQTVSGIPFREESRTPGTSPVENFAQDQSRAVQVVMTPWETRSSAKNDFLGRASVVTDPVTLIKHLQRLIPYAHPTYPNFLYCDSVSDIAGLIGSGIGPDTVADYDEAKMKLNYVSYLFNIIDDFTLQHYNQVGGYTQNDGFTEASLLRYMTPNWAPGGKFQTLPTQSALRWVTDQVPVVLSQVILLPEGDLSIQWEQVPIQALNMKAMMALIGKTNLYQFGMSHPLNLVSGLTTTEPGTLVMLFPGVRLIRRPNGDFAYTVTLKFKKYPYGANCFFRYDALNRIAGWQQATIGGKPANEVNFVYFNATGGTFVLTVQNLNNNVIASTAAELFNISAAILKTELENLPNVGAGKVKVSGKNGSFSIDFTGLGPNYAIVSIDGSQLAGPGGVGAPISPATASSNCIFPYADYNNIFSLP
jgi:hypothetical protein